MSAPTKAMLKTEDLCKSAIKAMNVTSRHQIVAHLVDLQTEENVRLLTQADPVRIHRAQGAVTALQGVIDLLIYDDVNNRQG